MSIKHLFPLLALMSNLSANDTTEPDPPDRSSTLRSSSALRLSLDPNQSDTDRTTLCARSSRRSKRAREQDTDDEIEHTATNDSEQNEGNLPQQETARARKTRLQREKRLRESSEQRARRLSIDAQQTASARKRETSAERSRRLSAMAQHNAACRDMETPEERTRRLSANAQITADTRNMETPEERTRRLSANAQITAATRNTETPEERTRRLSANAQITADTRNMETPEERTRRLSANAQNTAATRNTASEAETVARRLRERSRHRDRNRCPLEHVPVGYSSSFVEEHYIGPMEVNCAACGAKFFRGEATPRDDKFNVCCNFGSIEINHFEDFPESLKNLFIGTTPSSINFRENIRNFNSALAMASMGCQLTVPRTPGPYCYKVHGQVYHYIGSVQPDVGTSLQYGQLYILDTQDAANERMGKPVNTKCEPALMRSLSELIARINPYANSFKMMWKVALEEERKAAAQQLPSPTLKLMFHLDPSLDRRRYNIPASNEVAAVFVGEENDVPATRSIALHLTGGGLQRIRDIDKMVDPLTYPLLFPTGSFGWHPDLNKSPNPDRRRNRVSQREYYSFLLSIRTAFNPILRACKLLQQFAVDSWTKIEQNRLHYARTHQSELRADAYQSLVDHINTGVDGTVPGARIILPSSFSGTPRNMQQSYQDAMAIVTKYGKPDFFLTFTCNPKWKEILENLLPGQTAADRPDLVARVFNMKMKALLDDILKKHVLGQVTAYICVVEWQKRGLPHCHMLLTMAPSAKPRTVEQVDQLIRAYFPDSVAEPELFEIVAGSMIHRNCGVNNPNAPCMVNGECSKKYPKPFQDQTRIDLDSFPLYYRPDNGRTVTQGNVVYDNRHVVPHNAYLSMRYNAHINLEICSLIHAVKYLYKYVYKGIDRASLKLKQTTQAANNEPVDEIRAHLDTRFICAPEAIHRIFEFETQRKSDTVYRLQVHLPDQQTVVFDPNTLSATLDRAQTKLTTLTAWFKMNREFDPAADNTQSTVNPRDSLYINFPENFTFVKASGLWKPRQRGTRQIGRMYMASPKDRERYCLRLLLLHRRGMTSFEDLRTYGGQVYPTFSAVAKEMGYLRDENHFDRTMSEAVVFGMPSELRSLFGALLAFSDVCDAPMLWNKYQNDLSEDYVHQGYNRRDSYIHAYFDLLDISSCMGVDLTSHIPPPAGQRSAVSRNSLSLIDHANVGLEMYAKLTVQQKNAADAILQPSSNCHRCYFVDGPGGSGKTFLYNCIYHKFVGEGKKVACVAWTGIAANLLPEGRTCHSLFKLSVPQGNRICTVKNQTKEARSLRETDVFIIDECSMVPKWSLDAVDQLLRDTMAVDVPFGGKIVILGGDFRQVLPVVERGRGSDAVDACLKHSAVFPAFKRFSLTENMRCLPGSNDWSSLLLEIGNGSIEEDNEGCIPLPSSIISGGDLLTEIFGDKLDDSAVFAERAILAPKNVDVNEMNDNILKKLQGRERTFLSIDEIDTEDPEDSQDFPVEFLNKQNPAGTPPHLLKLKVGAVVMLLRNLDVSRGLCNGTRFAVVDFSSRVIQCKFISGPRKGSAVFIPRIDNYTEKALPFRLRRRQFPIRLAFAMTINKAQGQSLTHVGLYLPEPVFGHGQLYVALSRARSMEGVKVLSHSKTYKNIVEKGVL